MERPTINIRNIFKGKVALVSEIASQNKVTDKFYRGLLIIPFFQETNEMNKIQGINFSE